MTTIAKNLPLCTHRYAMFVSYLGSKYNGSQRLITRVQQGKQDTVQEALEWSLETFLPVHRCRVTACSRTDKGVHALVNCYSLPLMDFKIPTDRLKRLANTNLTRKQHEIIVNDVILVPAEWHPRKFALSREYIYRLAVLNGADTPKIVDVPRKHNPEHLLTLLPITEMYRALPVPAFDKEKALEAIDLLKGEHDFRSFAFSPDDDHDTVRDIEIGLSQTEMGPSVHRTGHSFSLYQLHFKCKSFMHNQVRRLVGAIITYASYDRIKLSEIKWLLDNPDSKSWRPYIVIAEPWGLYLSRVHYNRSALKGSIRTYEDGREEKVESFEFLHVLGMSDDSIENEEKISTCS